jgi:hypothetical protein
MDRIKLFSITCLVIGTLLFFWWPFTHWFFPDFYHQLLGFLPGTYQKSMVKVIGTCGLLPVFCFYLLAIYPRNNWPLIFVMSLFSLLFGLTFLYLIATKDFPSKESMNAITTLAMSVLLPVFYKWANKKS